MDTNRRDLLGVGTALLCGTAGCLSASEGDLPKSTLVIKNQRGTELEFVIRFTEKADVLIEETLDFDGGGPLRVEVEFPRDVRQVTLVVELLSPQEAVYEESVPGGVPEYDITIKSDSIDVVWAEN